MFWHLLFSCLRSKQASCDNNSNYWDSVTITLLHSERPKLYGVLAVLSAVGLTWDLFPSLYIGLINLPHERGFYVKLS